MTIALLIAAAASLLSLVIAPATDPLLRFLVGGGVVVSLFGAAIAARWPGRWWVTVMAAVTISGLVLTSGVVPIVSDIVARHQGARGIINDTVPQMEAAAGFLLKGKNPYRENYHGTVLDTWDDGRLNGKPNPIYEHLVMPPGHVLASTALAAVANRLFGFYDERTLTLVAYLLVVALAARLGYTIADRLRSVALLGLNPLFLPFVLSGTSDAPVLAALLATGLALQRRRWYLAAALAGLAVSLKAFAWVFLPAIAIVLVVQASGANWTARIRTSVKPLLLGFGIALGLFLTFLLWDAPALYDDLIRYVTGYATISYPIMGIGFSGQLRQLGVVGSDAHFPFWVFQLSAVSVFLGLMLPILVRRPTISRLFLVGTGGLFLTLYFGRYFHTSHAAILLFLLTVAFAWWLAYERTTPPGAFQLTNGQADRRGVE